MLARRRISSDSAHYASDRGYRRLARRFGHHGGAKKRTYRSARDTGGNSAGPASAQAGLAPNLERFGALCFRPRLPAVASMIRAQRWCQAARLQFASMRTSDELREGFLKFYEDRAHVRRPSGSLVPETYDPTVLLTTAGMQPLRPYFLGLDQPPAPRLVTVQKCFRTTDIDEVGLTARHLTFFEMLGNFSIGDYFKDGAVDLAWEFVNEHMRLPQDKLWATVFAGDPELRLGRDQVAVAAWERVGIPPERIVDLPGSDNFWQGGPTGPCGPCSELYYDRGPEHGCDRPDCAPGCECDRYLEFYNLVFMEFDLHDDGTLTPLPQQNIDTGLGVERGAALLQDVFSVYETDGFQAIM